MLSDRPGSIQSVAWIGAPTRRVQILEQLLEHYTALVDPMQQRANPGEGAGLMLMAPTYTPSVRELERLVRRLRDDRHGPIRKWTDPKTGNSYAASPRRLWWHLNAWYIQVEHVLYTPPNLVKPNRKRKQLERPQVDQHGVRLPQVRVLRHPEARYPIAHQAVHALAEQWGLTHEPMLPRELTQAA